MRIALVVAGGVDRSGRERVVPSLHFALLENPARCEALAHEAPRRAHACDVDWTAAALERLYETMSAHS